MNCYSCLSMLFLLAAVDLSKSLLVNDMSWPLNMLFWSLSVTFQNEYCIYCCYLGMVLETHLVSPQDLLCFNLTMKAEKLQKHQDLFLLLFDNESRETSKTSYPIISMPQQWLRPRRSLPPPARTSKTPSTLWRIESANIQSLDSLRFYFPCPG